VNIAIPILKKLSQKAMGFVVFSNRIHSLKINLHLNSLVRQPPLHDSPTQYNKLLRARFVLLYVKYSALKTML